MAEQTHHHHHRSPSLSLTHHHHHHHHHSLRSAETAENDGGTETEGRLVGRLRKRKGKDAGGKPKSSVRYRKPPICFRPSPICPGGGGGDGGRQFSDLKELGSNNDESLFLVSCPSASDQLAIAKEVGRRREMGTNMYPSSSLLCHDRDENEVLPIDELIEKADGFAGVFLGI